MIIANHDFMTAVEHIAGELLNEHYQHNYSKTRSIDEDGTTYCTDEAQEKFNEFYDFVEDVIVSNLMLERLEDSNWKVKEEVNG